MKLLHAEATPAALRFVRIWVFGIWAGIAAFDPIALLAELPPATFEPAGFILNHLPDAAQAAMLDVGFLHVLRWTTVVVSLLVVFDRLPLFASLAACVLLTLHQGIVRGFGMTDHHEIGLLLAAYLLALFSFADAAKRTRSTTADGPSAAPALVSVTTVFLFTYAFTGIHRLTHGGLEIYSNIVFGDLMKAWVVWDSNVLLQPIFSWKLDHLLFDYPIVHDALRYGFPVVNALEILAPFCLVSARLRFVFLAVMIPFHLMVWLFMKIFFWENLLLFVLLVDLDYWITWVRQRSSAWRDSGQLPAGEAG